MRKTIRLLLAILLVNFSFIGCFASSINELIDKTESSYAIPSGLLKSITSVESGNKPYALNIEGKTIIANSKEEAARIVKFYQNEGITDIDLGIAQINLRWHGKHFSSISEMLEPKSNLEYAAKFLNELYRKHGSWNKAVRHYHSANPEYHRKYSRKVLIACVSRFGVMRKTIRLLLAILLVNFSFIGCFASNIDELIDKTENSYAIPSGLLKSITSVESGNKPYALNIEGKTIIANSKEEAVKIVRLYQDEGVTNIDLGLAQINLHWHGKHFSSISEMLEPKSNLEYAAKFLNELYHKHGSWNKAVRYYHSANPEYHKKYSRKVLIAWLGSLYE